MRILELNALKKLLLGAILTLALVSPAFGTGSKNSASTSQVEISQGDEVSLNRSQPAVKYPIDCQRPPSVDIASICNEMLANKIASSALAEAKRANNVAETSAGSSTISAYVAGVAAILAFFGTVISYFALREGRRSADAALKALDADRAMMMPDQPSFDAEFTIHDDGSIADCKIYGQIPWKNVGKRMAFGVGVLLGITSRREGWPLPELPLKIDVGDWVNVEPSDILSYSLTFTGMEAQMWLVSQDALYLYSAVTYQDRLDLDIPRRHELILKVEAIRFSELKKNVPQRVNCQFSAVKEPRDSSFGNGPTRTSQLLIKLSKIAADQVLRAVERLIRFF